MFTVVLINKIDGKPLRKVYAVDNNYLSREEKEDSPKYPLLSEISEVDICVFNHADMNDFIGELKSLASILDHKFQEHISDIIQLAEMCKQNEDYVLGVTSFSTFLNETELKEISKARS